MVLSLLKWLQASGHHVSPLLFSLSFRMLLTALLSFTVTVLCGKMLIRKLYELKVGHTIRVKDCAVLMASYTKSTDTPSMGGILFLSSMLIAGLVFLDLQHLFSWVYLLTLVFMAMIGGYDDYRKMKKGDGRGFSGRKKLFLEVMLGCVMCGMCFSAPVEEGACRFFHLKGGRYKQYDHNEKKMAPVSLNAAFLTLYIPFCKKAVHLKPAGFPILFFLAVFVFAGSANGVNLTDGLDGLAIGCTLFVAIVFAILAFVSNHIELSSYLGTMYVEGASEIGVFLAGLIGASLGFLWFNSFPAQVFMGDIGSLTIGALLGLSAALLRREILLSLVGGIFVIETLSVIVQVASFRLRKKRVFQCAPLHHHFECKGWHEVKVVMRFWMIGLLLALLGLISIKV
ncbi:MAG: phospho-N-acetylmuramoyl-pentapeptide-transferase [Chlamydiae bacterium RIFCSPHIGHO2_12_FULL_49_11]|nr:MAG: phospho-N-acetylmuramoyl-pentapeptide-transferase [Chlamydiae bacterium RIFCSPHIGHO2_12_FULL_49_11]